MNLRAAVDIGGTFTDVVLYDAESGLVRLAKALSTPKDLIRGVFQGLAVAQAPLDDLDLLVHGTTLVVNSLIERKGARTALVTTKGFRDIYEIGRINRPDAFNLKFAKHKPLIPREMIFEVRERVDGAGLVATPLDESEALDLADRIRELGVEAIAVMFLHAYRNPVHELRMGDLLREQLPGCYVSLSHEISREYREFERTSTVAANAYVGPRVSGYLEAFQCKLDEGGCSGSLAIMQSNGGICDVNTAKSQCVQMLESGPAGGIVGTIAMCKQMDYRQAIAFDMGGTTAKSAVIRNLTMPLASDYFLGGYNTGLPIRIPCIDIVEVGTGGGSIAWLDGARGVHVGPHSAGADPGPACYGQGGTDPTITDATVVLGHLAPGGALFGGIRLDANASEIAVSSIGDELGLDPVAMAAGILQIGAAAMANSVRAVTTQRGLDPRDFVLFAYGGNGPLHISLVARELGISRVVIPPMPSVFSALGMLMADARYDIVQTKLRDMPTAADTLEADFSELERACEKELVSSAVAFRSVHFERAADMRYVGQEHTVTAHIPPGTNSIKALFDAAHETRYSHSAPDQPAEIVSLRVAAVGHLPSPELPRLSTGQLVPDNNARLGVRKLVFDPALGWIETPVFDRQALLAGNQIVGPAVIEEPSATTLLRPGDVADVDSHGNLLLTIGLTR